MKGAIGVASFLTLKSPFCKYETANQDDDRIVDNAKQASKLKEIGNSIKENLQIISFHVSYVTLWILMDES